MNAEKYDAVLTEEEDGRFHAKVPAIQGCFTQGCGIRQALNRLAEVIDIIQETTGTEVSQLRVSFVFLDPE